MNWNVPNMWEGGEVWILGGGPSLTEEFNIPEDIVRKVRRKEADPSIYSPYLTAIHEKHVIGINMAFKIGNWIDMVFFGDGNVLLKYREELAQFAGLKICCNPKANTRIYREEKIKYLSRDHGHTVGISDSLDKVSWNQNSGAAAISVAANAGATRIVLVGFDMTLDEKDNQHWHTLYKTAETQKPRNARKLPFNRHLKGFQQIKKDAKERGIEIINVSPNSEIKQFKKLTIKEVLEMAKPKTRALILPGVKHTRGYIKPPKKKTNKRFDWLSSIVKQRNYTIGAEIGCSNGRTTGVLLRRCPNVFLYLVDLWSAVPEEVGGGIQYKDWDFARIKNRFDGSIRGYGKRTKVLQGISWDMANKVEDNSLDFIFVDADHEYESVKKDILAWTPKLKERGMISGHDTHFDGVMKALKELIPSHIEVGIDHCWEAKKEDVLMQIKE